VDPQPIADGPSNTILPTYLVWDREAWRAARKAVPQKKEPDAIEPGSLPPGSSISFGDFAPFLEANMQS